jgi:hypothetical protein
MDLRDLCKFYLGGMLHAWVEVEKKKTVKWIDTFISIIGGKSGSIWQTERDENAAYR